MEENQVLNQTYNTKSDKNDTTITHEVKKNRTWFMVLGVVTILLGVAAIVFPFIATLATELFIGGVLVIGGVGGIVNALHAVKWKGFLLSMLTALLALVVGTLFYFSRYRGIVTYATSGSVFSY